MSKPLTVIEKLGERFPGLVVRVKMWFDLGCTSQEVSELLHEQYGISIRRSTVAYYRARRWAPERAYRYQRRIIALALQEISHQRALKAYMAARFGERREASPDR